MGFLCGHVPQFCRHIGIFCGNRTEILSQYHVYTQAGCSAACCSVLQRVAACCSVLQHVAMCCSVHVTWNHLFMTKGPGGLLVCTGFFFSFRRCVVLMRSEESKQRNPFPHVRTPFYKGLMSRGEAIDTLQHAATRCNTLQHAATHQNRGWMIS